MAGLPGKPNTARAQSGGPQAPGPASGVSGEEREELMAQIEKAVARTPAAAYRSLKDYTPRRSGLAFPLVLNAAAVALVALAAVALPWYFNRQAVSLTRGPGSSLTGESSIVGAMRRETEAQLRTKNEEIGKIQGVLARTSQELDAMKADAAAQLQKKEQELQADFDAKVAAEKTRLQGAGLSAADADRQLATLRGQLQAAHDKELADLQRQLDADLARKQAALDATAAESRQSLARAEAEKAQLQAQMDSATQAANRAEGEKDLLAARLEALTAQNQREQLALDQITSSYATVAAAMQDSRLDDARATLSSLAAFLDQPGVAALPAVERRKPVDLFLMDSLSQLVVARAAGSGSTASAPPAPAAAASNPAAPVLTKEQAATLARLTAFSDALAAGDAAYAAGNVSGAVDRYSVALSLLKEDVPGTARLAARIADAGFRQGQADLLARADRAARPGVDAADALARSGNYAEAFRAYAAVLRTWPGSSYGSRCLAGISASLDSLLKAKDQEIARQVESKRSAADDAIDSVASGLSSVSRSAEATASAAQKELISLLDAKVKVKSILSSDSVKAQYPGLADALERYLALFGDEKKAEGRTAALQDVSTVLDYLLGERGKDALAPLWNRYGEPVERNAFQQLLDRVRRLFP